MDVQQQQQCLPQWKSRKAGKHNAKEYAGPASRNQAAENVNAEKRAYTERKTGHFHEDQALAFMLLDVVEEASGSFKLWGTTDAGRSVLVRVHNFQPYMYVATPESKEREGRKADDDGPDAGQLEKLKAIWNRSLPSTGRVQGIEVTRRTPIMAFRPKQPRGSSFLKISFPPGFSMKKAGRAIHESKAAVQSAGFTWDHADMHEHEVHLLQRFLVDTSLSAGCWTYVAAARTGGSPGHTAAPAKQRVSTCEIEAEAPWQSLQALTPDATQMTGWSPEEVECREWRAAREAAGEGRIASLRLMTLDVKTAPRDGKKRVPVAASDPVVAITSIMNLSDAVVAGRGAAPELDAAVDDAAGDASETGAMSMAPAQPVGPDPGSHGGDKVVLTWQKGGAAARVYDPGLAATVKTFGSEQEMLREWLAMLGTWDPDALVAYQVKDTLGVLAERFRVLRLEGGGLHISRAAASASKPVALKRVVQYTPNWVKNQQRMASTSNQETFRADIEGRLVFDILRHVLTACNLASFSLVDCVSSLLGRPLEVLPPDVVAGLAGLADAPPALARTGGDGPEARAQRLARYSCAHAEAVQGLLARLSTIAETLELARATGLTAGQALYNAQMIRTHSLLLRTARRTAFIVGGRQETVQLQESPYLMHPVEESTVGLYREPVAVLDFASLYPSLFRAHNLSYDTLLHAEDAGEVDPGDTFVTPTGDRFVAPAVRRGILPAILGALIEARTATRRELEGASDPARRAVLDSRQKALKVTANALYGFTGAQASPLQCVQLADSCLALGAAACRRAKQLLDDLCSSGGLGQAAEGGRVIYGQTDSLFCHFPRASAAEAVPLAHEAARRISEAFPPEMQLKFERVCRPFMLLHVNRYAGKAFETPEAAEEGVLLVKGLRSMWRQAAPILRTSLQGILHRIIMQEDIAAAVAFVEAEVRRLLEGRVELSEMVMTGGLWRLTGQQLEKAAHGGSAEDGADVRGPHATLAVKLQQRDRGRSFVLGERLQYVLLPGERLQDEAAEDPLTALLQNRTADYELYWRTKLQKPLQEVFATCLPHAALQKLMNGPHTKVRVDQASGGAHRGAAQAGPLQTGLSRFYKATVRCLACKRPIPKAELGKAEGREPGLCRSCKAEEGVRARVQLEVQAELDSAEAAHHTACAACMHCHSGGLLGPILCENGECVVLYPRISSGARLTTASHNLRRLEW